MVSVVDCQSIEQLLSRMLILLALEYETNTPYASAKSDDDAEAAPSNNTLILLLTRSILVVIE